ncbi:hypothetical protein WICANDRAFT_65587 [Wickerhamomyces anomalus NRRL Y-366-8]|uniref:Uncharacterized protein n=1 Tax=Wickerhamomyces anomalus (strain ATCC 58044 / CBS 1984 / NCYC 433 / NRRL Y-366-8) TaxID=683960 RepID=A0A1E3NVY3_WICAA|nr:uncharacterized protein WICANDRAFT_65587 [Wickerhamomyces anomalus NRRL Y-366-8]ODQ57331.1 hypothetical protein WICANDRAFT_65587 [Wickerhamomyces anomalus NRRL Y-366-8]
MTRAFSLSTFDYNGRENSSKALIKGSSEDNDPLKKSASRVLKALLFPFPSNASTYKQVLNIMKMGSAETEAKAEEKKEKSEPIQQHGKTLQTKNIQKITRNDLINGTYDLNPKPIRTRSTADRARRHHRHHRHHHHNENGEIVHRSRSKTSTPNSIKSPSSSISPEIRNIAHIDDDAEKNEMFMAAHEQVIKDQMKKSKRASDSELLYQHTHTDDGTLTVPVHRTVTLDSDVSDYYSSYETN